MSGSFPPGTRLDEQSVADRFGVSRTPVREALRQVANSGLIILKPRQGAVVATLTLHELIHMFEVMASLEGLCGRLAARRMAPRERDKLRNMHESMRGHVESRDTERYHAMNAPFHVLIYEGAHNPFLCEQTLTLRKRLAPYRAFQLNQPGRLEESYEEHLRIVDAICARDADAAAQLLTTHVELQGEALGDLVSRMNQLSLAQAG